VESAMPNANAPRPPPLLTSRFYTPFPSLPPALNHTRAGSYPPCNVEMKQSVSLRCTCAHQQNKTLACVSKAERVDTRHTVASLAPRYPAPQAHMRMS
jgi:hypothetical protein